MSNGPFWVVGGDYTDTSFTNLEAGMVLEQHGPYDDYGRAFMIWRGLTGATIDKATTRFRIVNALPA